MNPVVTIKPGEVATIQVIGKPWSLPTKVLMKRLIEAGMFNALNSHVFKKKVKLLMAHGVKTPKEHDFRTLVKFYDSMPEKVYNLVVKDWLSKQVSNVLDDYLKDPKHNLQTLTEDLTTLVPFWFGLADEPDDAKKLSLLFIACSEDDRAKGVAKSLNSIKVSKTEKADIANENVVDLVEYPGSEKIAKLSQGDFPMSIIRLLVAVRFGQWEDALRIKKDIEQFKNIPFDRALFDKAVKDHIARYRATGSMPAHKIQKAAEGEFTFAKDLEVLALCNMHHNDTYPGKPYSFSKVLAVKRPSTAEWKELPEQEARRLFPSEGSIVHFPGKIYPELPVNGEYGVWRVDEQMQADRQTEDKERFTHMLVKAKVMPVQQVRSFEDVSSDRVAGVINKFDEVLGRHANQDDRDVIRLADGLFIQLGDDEQDNAVSGPERFMRPINAWKNIEVIQLESGLNLHVGELPDTSRLYDMSDKEEIVVKALEQLNLLDSEQRKKLESVLEEVQDDQLMEHPIKELQLDSMEWKADLLEKLANDLREKAEISAVLEKYQKSALSKVSENSATIEAKAMSTWERAKETSRRRQAALEELQGLENDLDLLIGKHFHKIKQLGRRMSSPDDETQRSWFPQAKELVNSFNAEKEKLEKSLKDRKDNG